MSKIVLRVVSREIEVGCIRRTEWAVEIRQLTDSDLDHDDVIIVPCLTAARAWLLIHHLECDFAALAEAETRHEVAESDADAFDPHLGDLGVLAVQASNRKAGRS